MYNPVGDKIQNRNNNLFNGIILTITAILLTFLISIPNFAGTIEHGVSQDRMLQVINEHLTCTNFIDSQGQYITIIDANPKIFLTAGNCYIEFRMTGHLRINHEQALSIIIQRYDLKSWPGSYTIEYLDNQINISLSQIRL